MYSVTAIAIASAGSRIIYGLQRRVAVELELGQYRLERKLGGEVYVARHALLRRPTAVKLVEPARSTTDALERAVQEMSQLRHHNTVAVYDYGRTPDGAFYVAMEYVEGIALDVLSERYGAVPTGRVIAILVQLCAALHEAHLRGFAHGNIKRSNVILCERGGLYDVAKLTDFGFPVVDATPAADLRALHVLASALGCDGLDACFAKASSAKEVLAALQALDELSWTPDHARVWWREHRRTSEPFLQVPTTLAVDLARRSGNP
jgi:serine/threonine-protein kinase